MRALVEGEAGIGKTTVWLAAVREAGDRGFRVLQARPAESESRLSYAALADIAGVAFDEVRAALLILRSVRSPPSCCAPRRMSQPTHG